MRLAEIENIWTADLSALSNSDRGRIYFERAKQVVANALADPAARALAVEGERFRRAYLIEKIGCQPAVTTQNPKIKQLLYDTDQRLVHEASQARLSGRTSPGGQLSEVGELQAIIDALQRFTGLQAAEIANLRRKLRDTARKRTDFSDHGRLIRR